MVKVLCILKGCVYSAGDRATRLHLQPPQSTAAGIRHRRLQPEEPVVAPVPKYKGFMTSASVIVNKCVAVTGKHTRKDFPFVSRFK